MRSLTLQPVTEIRQRTSTRTSATYRDSESIQAVKEIDQVIDSHPFSEKNSNTPDVKAHNGEIAHSDSNKIHSLSEIDDINIAPKSSYNQTIICIGEAFVVFVGMVCFVVLIAALESKPRPGQTDAWSQLASGLQKQPVVASFNSYVYSPAREHVVGVFSAISSWFGGH